MGEIDMDRVLAGGQELRKRCRCGGEVTINFNGEDLCPKCYQGRMRMLPKDEKRREGEG